MEENPDVLEETDESDEMCCFRVAPWKLFAVAATTCFILCNAVISEVTSQVGPIGLFYFASGSILTGLIHNVYFSI